MIRMMMVPLHVCVCVDLSLVSSSLLPADIDFGQWINWSERDLSTSPLPPLYKKETRKKLLLTEIVRLGVNPQ